MNEMDENGSRGSAELPPGSPVAVALDLGGTNLRAALVGPGGVHGPVRSWDTPVELGYEGVLGEVVRLVEELGREAGGRSLTVVGIGIGAPGPLDREAGVVEFAPNLGWRNAPLAADLVRATGIAQVRLENDANAATFAEAWVGESSGARCLVGVTLGTGIGGGLVIGGRLFAGARGMAMEPGHTVVVPEGRLCRCGKRGCAEAYFSAWGLVQGYREAAGAGAAALEEPLTPEAILAAWSLGEPAAAAAVETGLRAFALVLAGAVNLLNPDRIAFFGGLTGSWDLFGPPLVARVGEYALPANFASARFGPSRLAWPGVLGAGGLLLNRAANL